MTKTNLALNVKLSTRPHPFVIPHIKQRELCVLNHFAYVVLKPHYFSICCRGAASTDFSLRWFEKTSPREKVYKVETKVRILVIIIVKIVLLAISLNLLHLNL